MYREFALIDHIRTLFATLPKNGFEGIGDDCTVLPLPDGQALALTCDTLCEGYTSCAAAPPPAWWGARRWR